MSRDELIRFANAHGWLVTGYKWVRMTRADTAVEAWFAGDRSRLVSIHRVDARGECKLNIASHGQQRVCGQLADWVTDTCN